MKRIVFLILYFLLSVFDLTGENHYIDSLTNVLNNATQDSVKIKVLKKISYYFLKREDSSIAINYFKKLIQLQELELLKISEPKKLKIKKNNLAYSYENIAGCYSKKGAYPIAIKNIFIALRIFQDLKEPDEIMTCYNTLGAISLNQGNPSDALKLYFSALAISEKIGDKEITSIYYNNIANVYIDKHDFIKALSYSFISLKLRKELGLNESAANSYNTIGEIYNALRKYLEALKYYQEGYNIAKKSKNNYLIAVFTLNLGNIKTKIAISKTKQIEKEIDFNQAEKYLDTSIIMFREMGIMDGIKEYYQNRVMLDTARGNYKQAFEDHTQYVKYKDSLINEDNIKETERLKMQYEYDKKEIDQKQEDERKASEIQRKAQVQYMGVLFFLVLVFVFIFIAGRVQLSEKVISWSGFIGALMLFEFVLALLEPTINKYTNGLPVLFMVINISLAICIKPIHHFIETRLVTMAKRLKEKRSITNVNEPN